MESTFAYQNNALRDPQEISSVSFKHAGINDRSVNYYTRGNFTETLSRLQITLFISREYEHFLTAFHAINNKVRQSFFPMPHPAGIAVNRKNNCVYVASTRNPNKIVEFCPVNNMLNRKENSVKNKNYNYVLPSRVKFYPGAYYFHDLAIINGELFANAVGMNGIIKVNFDNPRTEGLAWWPKCVEKKDGAPDSSSNHIQLNSIAAGNSVNDSFFTASGSKIIKQKPGQNNYPVNKRGVVFSGKTGEVIADGLTRPHAAKLYKNKLWLANSGYGEFGYIDNHKFFPVIQLPGWTRGLCLYNDVAFVGVSRILPRFSHYAPGLKNSDSFVCSVYAISISDYSVLGSISWPHGNQIFAIDFMQRACLEFPYYNVNPSNTLKKSLFYNSNF